MAVSATSFHPAIKSVCDIFKISSLYPEQGKCLEAIFEGKDVYASLPTGYGKSLIFFAAPIVADFFLRRPGGCTQATYRSYTRSFKAKVLVFSTWIRGFQVKGTLKALCQEGLILNPLNFCRFLFTKNVMMSKLCTQMRLEGTSFHASLGRTGMNICMFLVYTLFAHMVCLNACFSLLYFLHAQFSRVWFMLLSSVFLEYIASRSHSSLYVPTY